MIQSVAFGRRLSPDDPVRWEPVLLVQSRMRPSGASGSHLSPDAPVWGAAARAACSAQDVPVRGIRTPSSAFCCRFVLAAPSCFAPYDPVLGTPCLRLLLAASPRPRPGVFLTASPHRTFIVISTLCVCCASPAACCRCRVSCCLFLMTKMFYLLKYNQSRITQARDKQVEENQDQSMKGCSVNSER